MISFNHPWLRGIAAIALAVLLVDANSLALRAWTAPPAAASENRSSPVEEENSGGEENPEFAACHGRPRHGGGSLRAGVLLTPSTKTKLARRPSVADSHVGNRAEHRFRNGCGAPLLF